MSWYLEVTPENREGLGSGRERYIRQDFGDVQKDSDGRGNQRSFCGCTHLEAKVHHWEDQKCRGWLWIFALTGTNTGPNRLGQQAEQAAKISWASWSFLRDTVLRLLPGPKPGKEGPFNFNGDVSDSRGAGGGICSLSEKGPSFSAGTYWETNNSHPGKERVSGHSPGKLQALHILLLRGKYCRGGGSC